MKHTFKTSTIKRIIFEEIQRAHLREEEEVKAAADEIVDELAELFGQINEANEEGFIDKIINLISKKSEEKE